MESEVIEAYLSGASILSLSKRFTIARGTIYRILDEAGVRQLRNKPVDPILAAKTREMMRRRKNPIAVGVELGVPAWWVRYVCKKG